MKAKINEMGALSLQRDGIGGPDSFYPQTCRNGRDRCDIFCSLFGEVKVKTITNPDFTNGVRGIQIFELSLCNKTLTLQSIEVEDCPSKNT